MTSKILNVSFWNQVMDIFPVLFNSLLMGLLVYFITLFVNSSFLSLMIGITIGFIYYIIVSYIFMPKLMKDALYLIQRKK